MASSNRQEAHLKVDAFRGVNLTDPEWAINDAQLASCRNLNVTDIGDLTRRLPIKPFTSPPVTDPVPFLTTIPLGFFFQRFVYSSSNPTSGAAPLVVLNYPIGGVGYQGGTQQVESTPVGTAGDNPPRCAVVWNNVLYVFTETNMTKIVVADWYNPPTVLTPTNIASAPSNIYRAVVFKDRIFAVNGVNVGSNTSRVYYCNALDPTTWGGFFDVNPGDGDIIVDMIVYQEKLFIFKQFSTWVATVTGVVSGWSTRLFDSQIGAIGPNCSVIARGLLFVVGLNSIYRCDGVIYDEIGQPIKQRLSILSTFQTIVNRNFTTMVDDNILFCLAGAGCGMWVYNTLLNAFTEIVLPSAFANMQLLTGQQGTFTYGERATMLGTRGTLANFGGNILWFNLKDYLNPMSQLYYDAAVNDTGMVSAYPTVQLRTKKWDFGDWAQIKRSIRTHMEMQVLNPAVASKAEFTARYYYDRVGVSRDYYILNTTLNRGDTAIRVPGFGRFRRLALELTSTESYDFLLTGLDLAYLQARYQTEAIA